MPSKDAQRAPQYYVGIDLGTTNTVMAFSVLDRTGPDHTIEVFPIEQLVGPGTVAPRPFLPSVRYHPVEGELAEDQCQLPWQHQRLEGEPYAVMGVWAQQLSRQVDGRGVVSAKSWLCHNHVDRTAAILPWGHDVAVPKISPMLAQASVLNYCRHAWNHAHPDALLEHQKVVLTVPASFDEAARALTKNAAQRAGLPHVQLLEEPHAACYDWLFNHRHDLSGLHDSRVLLVADVGGGTSDFSLMNVTLDNRALDGGELAIERVAVGEHLLLGGDNIDLALGLNIEQHLAGDSNKRCSASELSQIQQQSQWAKEQLLRVDAPESLSVTILGRGARLLKNKQVVNVTKAEVEAIALDQFLKRTPWATAPEQRQAGMVDYGLPYVHDPVFSKHLGQFLDKNQALIAEQSAGTVKADGPVLPDAVLLNGGFFHSQVVCDQVVELLQHWSNDPHYQPTVLANSDPAQAVARGAVAFQLAKQGVGLTIGGGAPHDYWLVVGNGDGSQSAVCILPRGTAEGMALTLEDHAFSVVVNQPVQFLVLTTDDEKTPLGTVAPIPESGHWLPPMLTEVDAFTEDQTVNLVATYSELGVLELTLVSVDGQVKQPLSLNLRGKSHRSAHFQTAVSDDFVWAHERLIRHWVTKGVDVKALKGLRAELEKRLGARDEWSLDDLRHLADGLIECATKRRRSDAHERIWLNWTGFCMRPAVGHPLDPWRLDRLWPLWEEGPHFKNQRQVWSEWWTFWRRLVPGLSVHQQHTILERIGPWVDPSNQKRRAIQADIKDKDYESVVRLLGSLEAISVERKCEAAQWLMTRLGSSKEPVVSWWALGSLGARTLLFAGAQGVVPASTVESWVECALAQDWRKVPQAAQAAVLMSRMCGERDLDVSPACRQSVLDGLAAAKLSDAWKTMVSEHVPLTLDSSQQWFGDGLPTGLVLV